VLGATVLRRPRELKDVSRLVDKYPVSRHVSHIYDFGS
jgi:hypothetical protein